MSRQDDLKQLIINYGRRLQKLQEQQALMGLDTPPHILIEIEDIEAKIAELQAKLATLANEPVYSAPENVFPARPQSVPSHDDQPTIFVGRQTQLTELNRHWQITIEQHRGKVLFLTGEAGIGKTSLVREFSQGVLARYPQVQYAAAQCDQITGDISAYEPFVQLLNSLAEQTTRQGQHWSVEFIREIGPDILGMAPVVGPMLATAAKSADFIWRQREHTGAVLNRSGQIGQQDFFQQFTDVFRNLARRRTPLLLFIDDWHWADTSSTSLLFHLARQLLDVPILLLATYRPHDAQARNHPILPIQAEMERYQLCVELALDFLSRTEIVAYLSRRFPQTQFEPNFVDWLFDITSGNALFLTEYVNLLLNEKLLTPAGHLIGDLSQILPPANVEAVIRTRLSYLDREARDMLAYASVEGEQFTSLLLGRVLDLKPLALLKRLRAIEETHQLIISLGQQNVYQQQTTVYRFVHGLIYQTLHNMLEAEERLEINRLLLELLAEIYERADEATKVKLLPELITHATEANNHIAVARYALASAYNAADKLAHVEALKQSAIGLQALKNVTEPIPEIVTLWIELLLRQGNTEDFMGNQLQSLKSFRQAEMLARGQAGLPKLERVLRSLGRTLTNLGHYDQALSCYQEAITLVEQTSNRTGLERLYWGMSGIYLQQHQNDQAWEWGQKALSVAEAQGNEAGIALACNVLGIVSARRREYDQALTWYRQAAAINEKAENKGALVMNHLNIGVVHQNRGDYHQALSSYQQALTIAQEANFKRGEASALTNLGRLSEFQGNYAQALSAYRQAHVIREQLGNKADIAWSYHLIGSAHYAQGDDEPALAAFHHSMALNEELGNKRGLTGNCNSIGIIYANLDDYEKALEWTHKALAQAEPEDKSGLAGAYNVLGITHHRKGDHDQALAALQQSLALNETLGNKIGLAFNYNNIGSVYQKQGQYAQAVERYQQALNLWQELGFKPGEATTSYELGSLYEDQQNYEQALDWYQKSLTIREKIDNRKQIARTRQRIAEVEAKIRTAAEEATSHD